MIHKDRDQWCPIEVVQVSFVSQLLISIKISLKNKISIASHKEDFKSRRKMRWFLQPLFSKTQLQPRRSGVREREGVCACVRVGGGGEWGCRRFPSDIHHFSPSYSFCHRHGDYSTAGVTETSCRVFSYKETEFFFQEGPSFPALTMGSVLQLWLGPNLWGGRSTWTELLGAGCTAHRISRPTWRIFFFFAAFTMIWAWLLGAE